jgi:hypothetical protein
MNNYDVPSNAEIFMLMPGVLIYRNFFKNYENVLDFFKKSENKNFNKFLMEDFYKWGKYGIMTEVNSHPFNHTLFKSDYVIDNKIKEKEKEIFSNIVSTYNFIKNNYLKKYANSNIWPSFYNKVNLMNEFDNTKIAFLKYELEEMFLNDQGQKIKDIRPVGSVFHTDVFKQDMDSKGSKLIFTVMMYLNDDYDGGEICFLSEDGQNVIGYKPKAGDIVAFPSCEPFWHGVLSFLKNDRYAIRANYFIDFDGSDEWHKNNFIAMEGKVNYILPITWLAENGKNFKTGVNGPDEYFVKGPPVILNDSDMEKINL